LWGVTGAKHTKGYKTAPEEYVGRVVAFLRQGIGPTP
jgi:hypothetical protein